VVDVPDLPMFTSPSPQPQDKGLVDVNEIIRRVIVGGGEDDEPASFDPSGSTYDAVQEEDFSAAAAAPHAAESPTGTAPTAHTLLNIDPPLPQTGLSSQAAAAASPGVLLGCNGGPFQMLQQMHVMRQEMQQLRQHSQLQQPYVWQQQAYVQQQQPCVQQQPYVQQQLNVQQPFVQHLQPFQQQPQQYEQQQDQYEQQQQVRQQYDQQQVLQQQEQQPAQPRKVYSVRKKKSLPVIDALELYLLDHDLLSRYELAAQREPEPTRSVMLSHITSTRAMHISSIVAPTITTDHLSFSHADLMNLLNNASDGLIQ
jgi:hypothetical protein